MYEKEKCYLSQIGLESIEAMTANGMDPDLALEICHIVFCSEDLYELEVQSAKRTK